MNTTTPLQSNKPQPSQIQNPNYTAWKVEVVQGERKWINNRGEVRDLVSDEEALEILG
jgi:hypothetical protein